MTDISKLKKGIPPKRIPSYQNILVDPRSEEIKNKPLQVMIPKNMFQEFSAKAGEEFGFAKGAKSLLFMKMWEFYKFHGTK